MVRRYLYIIWLCFAARAAFYAAAFPLWEGYDEWAHFAVIQRTALRGEVLVPRRAPVSKQVEASLTNVRTIPPEWAFQDGDGTHTAYEALQPPLYYWVAAPVLRLFARCTLPTQVMALRFLSVLIASLTIPLAYRAARSAFRNEALALGCAAVIAVMPEFAIDVARVANDCLAVVLFTLLTWLLIERRTIAVGVVLGLGLLTKAYFLTAVPAVLAILLWQSYKPIGLSTAIAGWWYIRNLLTTGSLSGLSESEMLRGTSTDSMIGKALEIWWPKAIDATLFSHLWYGGWTGLTVRSWMYHLFYLLIALAAIGLFRAKRQPALLAIYACFWLGQCYNIILIYATKGMAVSMGWYLYAVVAAEVALAVAGLRAIAPARVRPAVPAIGVALFALFDLYTLNAVAIPYYTGLIGRRGALHARDLIPLREIIAHLGPPAVIAPLWAAYLIATLAILVIAFRLTNDQALPGGKGEDRSA